MPVHPDAFPQRTPRSPPLTAEREPRSTSHALTECSGLSGLVVTDNEGYCSRRPSRRHDERAGSTGGGRAAACPSPPFGRPRHSNPECRHRSSPSARSLAPRSAPYADSGGSQKNRRVGTGAVRTTRGNPIRAWQQLGLFAARERALTSASASERTVVATVTGSAEVYVVTPRPKQRRRDRRARERGA
jgi:hypothetical protein